MRVKLVLFAIMVSVLFGCEKPTQIDGQASLKQNVQESVDSQKSQVKADGEKNTNKSSTDKMNKEEAKKDGFQPFYIYSNKGSRSNHYVPSGFMPNGNCISFNDAYLEGCHSGKTCIKINYDIECSREGQKWGGVYWLNPANNWGKRKGGYNLTGATKLTFWAKGENGGEQIQEFTIGGITGNYPDSDTVVIGPVILSSEWRQYTIDLRGKDLSHISGGFSWSSSEEVNPESCVFYLDEIRFE